MTIKRDPFAQKNPTPFLFKNTISPKEKFISSFHFSCAKIFSQGLKKKYEFKRDLLFTGFGLLCFLRDIIVSLVENSSTASRCKNRQIFNFFSNTAQRNCFFFTPTKKTNKTKQKVFVEFETKMWLSYWNEMCCAQLSFFRKILVKRENKTNVKREAWSLLEENTSSRHRTRVTTGLSAATGGGCMAPRTRLPVHFSFALKRRERETVQEKRAEGEWGYHCLTFSNWMDSNFCLLL